jgi:Uncharacterized homolog of gamma-carboxymuconolactone decarboxylase subunit
MRNDDRLSRGLQVRREVMGEARVASSMLGREDFAYDLQRLATEMAWAEVWTREGLDRRSRSISTVSMLLALNRSAELKAHFIGAVNNGLSSDELRELVIHSAIYCGFPAALEGMRVLREAVAENITSD